MHHFVHMIKLKIMADYFLEALPIIGSIQIDGECTVLDKSVDNSEAKARSDQENEHEIHEH